MKKIYKVGWRIPDNLDDNKLPEAWPAHMRGWNTGFGTGYLTYVGLVLAENEESTIQVVRDLYAGCGDVVDDRDMTQEVPARVDWDRFPAIGDTWDALNKLRHQTALQDRLLAVLKRFEGENVAEEAVLEALQTEARAFLDETTPTCGNCDCQDCKPIVVGPVEGGEDGTLVVNLSVSPTWLAAQPQEIQDAWMQLHKELTPPK